MNLIFGKTNDVPPQRSCGFEKDGLEIRGLVWQASADQSAANAVTLHASNISVALTRRQGENGVMALWSIEGFAIWLVGYLAPYLSSGRWWCDSPARALLRA